MARTAVIAGTATAVSNRVSRRQGERWQRQAYEEQAQQQPQQPVAAPAAAPTSIDQLKELAELHSQGVLTDEEFAAQKAKILGS